MADYYPLLARAVAGLAENTPSSRAALYDRARQALRGQLEALGAGVDEATAARELDKLEAVIARLEGEQPASGAPTVADMPTTAIAEPAPAADAAAAPEALPEVRPVRATEAGPVRPRLGADAPAKPALLSRGALVGVALAVVAMAVVGTVAFLNRSRPAAVAAPPAPPPVANAPAPRAPAERVPGPDQRPAAAPPAAPPDNVPPPPVVASRPADASVTPVPSTPPPLGIGQRLILVEETGDPATPIRLRTGSAVWRLETASAGQRLPPEPAIVIQLQVPDLLIAAEMMIRRNLEPTFPASHTVEVRFTVGAGSPLRAVQALTVLEAREVEDRPGQTMIGQGITVTENVFLVALSNLQLARDRNIEGLRDRPWFYVEVQFATGRRGAFIFEKGPSGQRVVDEAFARWQ